MKRILANRVSRLRPWALIALASISVLRCGDNVGPPPTGGSVVMDSGDKQSGPAGQALPQPLVVVVTDESGAPTSGVAVQWSPQGGGSVSKTSVTTGSDGRATVQRVLGPDLGQQTTTATVGGFTGSPVTFVATAVPPGQAALAITTQPPASALDAEVFDPASQPVITVRDEQGNPESGVIVTATV